MEERLNVEKFEVMVFEGKIINVSRVTAEASSAVLDFGEVKDLEGLKEYL